jgi:hypothetical protein
VNQLLLDPLLDVMVGVKTWEDEQIDLILTCKEHGKTVSEIIGLLKARWPRKVVKDSGVRYVMANYKGGAR